MSEIGKSLGHYRLVDKIGEGGMGVVWKAVDTKLDRDVAIKILPEAFAADPERLARFEREAKLLASLNHPNIATIHGLDEQDGIRFLVMELVAGEDMAARLERGALPIEEALALAVQLAAALEAAHEQGVIHRDLKPANVKLTPDGKIKVLDFGLAKAFDTGPSTEPARVSISPTVTSAGTVAGIILGTAAYMSPEQAKGKPVDRRADIWAFGVVLHEMLTGKRLFRGESVSETLAAVLMAEPDMQTLPANTPRRIRRLIERSLRKEPSSRLRDIGDARLVLEEALAGHEWKTATATAAAAAERATRKPTRMALLLAVAGLLAGAALGYVLRGTGSSTATRTVARLSVTTGASKNPWPFLMPDGKTFLYYDDDGALRARRLDGYEETIVRGSEGSTGATHSPDGKWIAFVRDGRLMKVPLDGSTPVVELGRVPASTAATVVWLSSGVLVFKPTFHDRYFLRFSEDQAAPAERVEVRLEGAGVNFFMPLEPLPDGRHFLAAADSYGEGTWRMNIVAVDVETGEAGARIEDGAFAKWSPTGHLLFTRGETLHAVAFDASAVKVLEVPVALLDGLATPFPVIGGLFDIADNGTLLYRTGVDSARRDRLAFLGADGGVEIWDETERDMDQIAASPDGSHVAVQVANWDEGLYEIWISELDRPRLRPLVDRPGLDCNSPVWTPDSRSIYYGCFGAGTEGGVYRVRIDGRAEAELLLEAAQGGGSLHPTSVSPDGSFLLLSPASPDRATCTLARAGSEGAGLEPIGTFGERVDSSWGAHFSRDGRWVAYASDRTGQMQIYIRSFGTGGELGHEIPVTTDGGNLPRWGRTSDELYYVTESTVYVVTLSGTADLKISEPREWLDTSKHNFQSNMAFLPDGRVLVSVGRQAESAAGSFNVVLDWFEELNRRAPPN